MANRMSTAQHAAMVAIVVPLLTVLEGYMPVAKHDPIDPPGVITYCFGRTNYDDKTLKAGRRATKAECQELLKDDLPKYEAQVDRCIHVPMGPKRYAAVLSFTYNLGGGALCKSRVARELNAGHPKAGCDAMMNYTRANGRTLQGLVNRRQAEHKLCLEDA